MRELLSILLLICFVSLCGCGPATPVIQEGDNRSTESSNFGVSPEIIIKPDEICFFDIVENNCVYSFADGTVCVLDTNTGKIKSSFIVERFDYDEDSNTADRLQYYDGYSQMFQISNASMPVLAVNGGYLDKGGDGYGLIDFYDLFLGKKLSTVRAKNDFDLVGLGFSGDGKYFYFWDLLSLCICCADVKSGDIIWRNSLSDFIGDAYMRADGKSYVIFSYDQAVAFNKDGDELWRIKTEDDEVGPTLQPREPSDVVLVFPEIEDVNYWIAAMSLQDGSIIWRKPGIEVESVRSTTKDRKKQAIYINGNMFISHYPEEKNIKIPGIKESCDAVFSQDGNILFCLPELQWISGSERKLTIKWLDIKISDKGNTLFRLPQPQIIDANFTIKRLRNSHILKVIDSSTGKVTKQIKLIKPVKKVR